VSQGRHRERGGVVIAPDRHPAGVGAQVIDPIRDRLADLGIGEVVHVDLDRLAGRPPLDPTTCVVADQFLLLGIDRDDRLAGGQVLAGLLIEVPKLRVPIRMLGALEGLAGALQPIPLLLEQPADGVV
jgi:hypothetical protein